MKILVTGANGLLGQKLMELLDKDESVVPVATARRPLTYPVKRAIFRPMDVTDAEGVLKVLQEQKPDVVINAAAMTQVDHCETQREECWRQNVGGVENLVKAVEDVNAHLVHVSTDFIFDGTRGPLTEDEQPAPVNFYGESKLAG